MHNQMPDTIIPMPPDEFVSAIGGGDFRAIGQNYLQVFVNQCGLLPSHNVLDIGSGCGRMAIPLTSYLDSRSEYHGVDIVEPMVKWCTENISPRFTNFRFHHAQLKNSLYSDTGESASKYKFPFPGKYFEFIFLTSVFTHLNPKDTQNYLQEITRMLKVNGRVLMTFFLMTEEYSTNRKNNKTLVNFEYGDYPYWVNNLEIPEAVSAYDETFILKEIRNFGLSIDTIYYGAWNRHNGLSWPLQDIVVASRKE